MIKIKNIYLVMVIVPFLFSTHIASQDSHREVIDAYSKLISSQEKYLSSVKKATKADDIAMALQQLNSDLLALSNTFRELERKYPNFSIADSKLPPEIKVLIASSEKLSSKITESTIISLYRYGNEEAISSAIVKTKEILRTITAFPDEKKQNSPH
ncbi:MAG: hypothetical protein N2316_10700 [Spirochaetes bacterium]|nr:hypothetical protein [Spirochaetota bacterium]